MGKDLRLNENDITNNKNEGWYLGRTAANLPENHFFKAIDALRQLH